MQRELKDGESIAITSDTGNRHVIRRNGIVYYCDCHAWKFQDIPIEKRTCKHVKQLRGENAESERIRTGVIPATLTQVVSEKIDGANAVFRPSSSQKPVSQPLMIHMPIAMAENESDVKGASKKVDVKFALAEIWNGETDPTGYFMSEKLDGVRAYWQASTRRFISRDGNVFSVPEWFFEGLPPWDLDGEMWGGRGKFQKTSGMVRRKGEIDGWKSIKYIVFDAPTIEKPFEVCIAITKKWFDEKNPPHASVLNQTSCKGKEHLMATFEHVLANGGEGIMLRKAGSMHVTGKTMTLLKVKPVRDAEARVIGYVPGKGKYTGMCGSLDCVTPDGRSLKAGGLTDKMRKNPPPIGTVITYKYQEFTDDGNPRSPRFMRVRSDMTWDDVMRNTGVNVSEQRVFNEVDVPIMTQNEAVVMTRQRQEERAVPAPVSNLPVQIYRYEFDDYITDSHKFWEGWVDGCTYHARWGRKGTSGTETSKEFLDALMAENLLAKKRREKEKEGYSLA